jgi:hypothetical protein
MFHIECPIYLAPGKETFSLYCQVLDTQRDDGRQFHLGVCTDGTLECVVVEFCLGGNIKIEQS